MVEIDCFGLGKSSCVIGWQRIAKRDRREPKGGSLLSDLEGGLRRQVAFQDFGGAHRTESSG